MPLVRPAPFRTMLLAAALAACGGPPDPPPTPAVESGRWWPPREYTSDPAVHGRVDAEDALAQGRPLRLLHGESDDVFVDPDTGLPVSGFGCCYEEPNARYLEAYNATIDTARAAGRLAGFDLRPLLTTADAAAALLAQSGRPFAYGDAPVAAPDGAHRVTIVGDSPTEAMLAVERADGSGRRNVRPATGRLRIAFTADGSVLVVDDGTSRGVETFDVARALQLQRFRR